MCRVLSFTFRFVMENVCKEVRQTIWKQCNVVLVELKRVFFLASHRR